MFRFTFWAIIVVPSFCIASFPGFPKKLENLGVSVYFFSETFARAKVHKIAMLINMLYMEKNKQNKNKYNIMV